MRYKAEIFDKLEYLYEVTKFSDHQLHCVITFDGAVNPLIMGKAMGLLLKTVPILSCAYRHNDGDPYWESVSPDRFEDAFAVVYNEADFNSFTTSRIDELAGPQIKACLYKAGKDSLSVIMNHMVCDAAGFKQCLYLLASLYSSLMENPRYVPSYILSGERGVKKVNAEIGFLNKTEALLIQYKESNQDSSVRFPMSQSKDTAPFILTHELPSARYAAIREYCKKNKVTVNDVVLAAYYRAISAMLKMEGETLSIPIMVDMRRYLEEKGFDALTNLTSTVNTHFAVRPGESFDETVIGVNKEMNLKKAGHIGLNGFVKLALVFRIFGNKLGYRLVEEHIKNPYIGETNIGVIDSERLVFKGSPAANAFMCGSIKYRPHFQIALSSFKDKMTFSSNLYGSKEDRETITYFFSLFDRELPR
jgi:NRPS condensation-like uncharacterized protein